MENERKHLESIQATGDLISSGSSAWDYTTPQTAVEKIFDMPAKLADHALNAFLIGVTATENRAEATAMLVRAARAGTIGNALRSLRYDLQGWIAAGYIRSDYLNSDQGTYSATEIAAALSSRNLDFRQIELLRKVYMVMASESALKRDDPRATEFLKVALELSSGEALVLLATHQIVAELFVEGTQWSVPRWAQAVAERSGLQLFELVEKHEQTLAQKNLLVERTRSDRSGFARAGSSFGNMTSFGKAFCEFVLQYGVIEQSMLNACARLPIRKTEG